MTDQGCSICGDPFTGSVCDRCWAGELDRPALTVEDYCAAGGHAYEGDEWPTTPESISVAGDTAGRRPPMTDPVNAAEVLASHPVGGIRTNVVTRPSNNTRCCRCVNGWHHSAPLPRPCHCPCHPTPQETR